MGRLTAIVVLMAVVEEIQGHLILILMILVPIGIFWISDDEKIEN